MTDANAKWKERLKQRRLANVNSWLDRVVEHSGDATFVSAEYDNILRALETAIFSLQEFHVSYRILEEMFVFSTSFSDTKRWAEYIAATYSLGVKQGVPTRSLIRLSIFLAEMCRLSTDHPGAKDALEKAQTLLQLENFSDESQYLRAKKLQVMAYFGDMGKAITDYYKQSINFDDIEDQKIRVYVALAFTYIFQQEKQFEQALSWGKKGQRIAEELNNEALITSTKLEQLDSLVYLDKQDEIQNFISELRPLLEESHQYKKLSRMHWRLARSMFLNERFEDAEINLHKAITYEDPNSGKQDIAIMRMNLGIIYTVMEKWSDAEISYRKSLEVFSNDKDGWHYLNAADGLAALYEAIGEYEKALDLLNHAVPAAKKLPDGFENEYLLNELSARYERVTDLLAGSKSIETAPLYDSFVERRDSINSAASVD